jgi:hypothetical protein
MELDGWILLVVAAVEIVNICLLLGLLYVYWGSYKQVKSKFAIGLLFFASTFLLKSILFVTFLSIFVLGGFQDIPDGKGNGGPFGFFLLNIIECIALAILFKITWE